MVGKPAPEFTLKGYCNDTFASYSLRDYRGTWVILVFYPLDFTFVCPTEIKGFAKQYEEFKKEDAEIFGISVDSEHSHKEWAKSLGGLPFPLLSDFHKKVADAYGVLIKEEGVALRGTFIINPDGVTKYAVISDNSVGRSVEETLRVLKALKTGDLCPIDWEPGSKTLGKA